MRRLPREALLALFVCLLAGAVAAKAPAFLSSANLSAMVCANAYLLLVALGAAIVIVAGGIDISVGSSLAVCATVAGLLARAGAPVPVWAASAVLSGAAVGAFNGALVAAGRVPPIIATLATMGVLRGLVVLAMRGRWITGLPPEWRFLGTAAPLGVPLPGLVAGVVLVAAWWFTARTRTGRELYAVGGNRSAAVLVGLNVRGLIFLSYLVCGALVGLGALLLATQFTTVQPNAGIGLELTAITAAVVGGVNIAGGSGTVWGAALGVLLLAVLRSGLIFLGVSPFWEKVVAGALVLAAVVSSMAGREEAAPRPATSPLRVWTPARREVLLVLALALLWLALGALVPGFASGRNALVLLRRLAEPGLVAVGLTAVMVSGGIDLSVGSIFGLAGVVCGFLWGKAGVAMPAAVAAALLVGLAAGLFNGGIVAFGRVPPLVVTLATMAIYRGAALAVARAEAVHDFPSAFCALGQGAILGVPTQLLILLPVALAGAVLLAFGRAGRYLYSVGENERAALFSSVPVRATKLAAYGGVGLLAALAGVIYISRVSTAKADAGLGLELEVITAVVLGGVSIRGGEGTVVGPLLALALLVVLREGIMYLRLPAEWQTVATGLVLLAAVMAGEVGRRRL